MADTRFGFSTHCVKLCVLASLFVFAHCLDLCIEVKKEYERLGFKEDSVPITPVSGKLLFFFFCMLYLQKKKKKNVKFGGHGPIVNNGTPGHKNVKRG